MTYFVETSYLRKLLHSIKGIFDYCDCFERSMIMFYFFIVTPTQIRKYTIKIQAKKRDIRKPSSQLYSTPWHEGCWCPYPWNTRPHTSHFFRRTKPTWLKTISSHLQSHSQILQLVYQHVHSPVCPKLQWLFRVFIISRCFVALRVVCLRINFSIFRQNRVQSHFNWWSLKKESQREFTHSAKTAGWRFKGLGPQ